MTSIKTRFARLLPPALMLMLRLALPLTLPLALMLFMGAPVFGQEGGANPSPLAAEIRNLERKLETGSDGPERRETWTMLARLQRLSGSVDAAARSWREAALADPANRDDRSLLESSLCYLALGEFDAASDALRGVTAGGTDSAAYLDARYLAAQIELFRSGSAAALYALLTQPEYGAYRPAIYYTFWRLFGDEVYRTQVLTEFPDSPEARILQNEASPSLASETAVNNLAAGTVLAQPRPLWFLYPGRGNIAIGRPVPVQPPEVPRQYEFSAPPTPAAATVPAPAVAAAPAPAVTGPRAGPRTLQTGLFSREENARSAAARLAAKGFAAEIGRKTVNGVAYWAVSVAPGEDSNRTIMRLKDAGFESFPVFE
jgi:cell division septation protein DedD